MLLLESCSALQEGVQRGESAGGASDPGQDRDQIPGVASGKYMQTQVLSSQAP